MCVRIKKKSKKKKRKKKENEKPYEIVDIVEKSLWFNNQNQEGQGQKILHIKYQMLSRLPIALAQLKAENNSKNLKNEIIQLLYYLYRSNKLTKIT